jgi:hypothetical protein
MRLKFYLLSLKQQLKYPWLILLIYFLFSSLQVNAQLHKDPWLHYGGGSNGGSTDSGYGITFSAEYDTPLGGLGTSFKPAPAFDLNLINYRGAFTVNLGIGYHSYNPRADTIYYDDGAGGTGTIAYQSFPVYSIYTGAAYNIDVSSGFRIYVGANLGACFTRYAYQADDQFSSTSATFNEENAYIAPKLGFNVMISSSVGLGVEGKYNFFSATGSSEDDPLVGTVLKSYAVGFVLTCKL